MDQGVNGFIQVRLGVTDMLTGRALTPIVNEKPKPMISGIHEPVKAGGQMLMGGAVRISCPPTVAGGISTSISRVMMSPAKTVGALSNMYAKVSPTDAPMFVIRPIEIDPNSPTSPLGCLFQK